jgi:hypothetical protein
MGTTRVWNKLDEERSKSKYLKIKFNLKSLEARKLKGLNMMHSQDRLKSHMPEEEKNLKIPMR